MRVSISLTQPTQTAYYKVLITERRQCNSPELLQTSLTDTDSTYEIQQICICRVLRFASWWPLRSHVVSQLRVLFCMHPVYDKHFGRSDWRSLR